RLLAARPPGCGEPDSCVSVRNPIEQVQGKMVHPRRVGVLCRRLADLLPAGARVLDVGCGDGLLSLALKSQRPDIALQGIETEVRKDSLIPVERFDGSAIPFPPDSFDVVLFVD